MDRPGEQQHDGYARELEDYGQALGYRCRRTAPDALRWERPGALTVAFTLRNSFIDVALAATPDTLTPWGRLPYDRLAHLTGSAPPACDARDTRCLPLTVLGNTMLCPGHYLLRLQLPPEPAFCLQPGQFFHLACDQPPDGGVPLALRRPFSIHNITYTGFDRALLARAGELPAALRDQLDRQPAEVTFLYKVVGRGTNLLTQVRTGQTVDAIGPCGNGFAVGTERHALLVAGGIGAAPLVALAELLRSRNVAVHLYLGALKSEFLVPALCRPDHTLTRHPVPGTPEFRRLITEEFAEIGAAAVHICTDDGSEGEKGFVTEVLARHLTEGRLPTDDVCVYACGPHGMLRATAQLVGRHALDCRVLLEERMACGIGACYACTCTTVGAAGTEKKRVCKDGPVFDAKEIVWER